MIILLLRTITRHIIEWISTVKNEVIKCVKLHVPGAVLQNKYNMWRHSISHMLLQYCPFMV